MLTISKFWLESLKGIDQLESQGVGVRTVLREILGKFDLAVWIRFFGSGWGPAT
jgi:hypothetical protein